MSQETTFAETLKPLEEAINTFFTSYTGEEKIDDKKIREALTTLVATASKFQQLAHLKDLKIDDQVVKIFSRIGTIFQKVSLSVFVNTKTEEKKNKTTKKDKASETTNYVWCQEMAKTSFKEIFQTIRNVHGHTVTFKNIPYRCSYHPESLFAHSHLAALGTLYGIQHLGNINELKCETEDEILYVILTSLLHDIGKLECFQLINDKKWSAFAGHAENGAGVLLKMYNEELLQYGISQANWENICQVIKLHMCGYHTEKFDKSTPATKYCCESMRINTPLVKKWWTLLSVGDSWGKVPEKMESTFDSFFNSRPLLFKEIQQEFSPQSFMKNNLLTNLFIQVGGMSGSGKSTCMLDLKQRFNDWKVPCEIVERDEIMCDVASRFLKEEKALQHPVSGADYKRYYAIYKQNNLGPAVNKEVSKKIDDAFTRGSVVIFDSVMTYFKGLEFVLPPSIKNALIVRIDVIRNELMTEKDAQRRGITLDEQLALHGEKSLCRIYPESSPMKDLMSRASWSSPLSVKGNPPHFVHQIVWSATQTIGLTETMRQMKILTTPFVRSGNKDENKEEKIDTRVENDIVWYANHVYQTLGWEGMANTFRAKGFKASTLMYFKGSPVEQRFLCIKYLENSRVWKPSWARQSRGIILYLNKEDKIVNLKYQLQRGAEILTGMQLKQGFFETQDYSNSTFDAFDTKQQTVIRLLSEQKAIKGFLSFKLDGSLEGVSCYSGSLKEELQPLVSQYGDPFAKATLKIAEDMKLPFMPVVSSQATWFAGKDMQSYYVTAMLVGLGHMSFQQLQEEAKTKSPVQVWLEKGSSVLSQIAKFYTSYKSELDKNKEETDVISLSFEAICPKRCTAWVGQKGYTNEFHTELAISYPTASFKFLSVSWGSSKINFKPHFQVAEHVNNAGFEEPLWWNVSHSRDIEGMIADLALCLRRKMDENKFLEVHPSANKYRVNNKYFDYEGYIFYADFDGVLDYSKVKTNEYYIAHKYRPTNIAYLMELNKTASEVFPLCSLVSEFYGNLKTNMPQVINDLITEFHKEEKENKFFQGLPEKARTGFSKRPLEIKYKMYFNASDTFLPTVRAIFENYYPSLKTTKSDSSDISGAMKGILMNLQPWKADSLNQNIAKMIDEIDMNVANLFAIILNQGVSDSE